MLLSRLVVEDGQNLEELEKPFPDFNFLRLLDHPEPQKLGRVSGGCRGQRPRVQLLGRLLDHPQPQQLGNGGLRGLGQPRLVGALLDQS